MPVTICFNSSLSFPRFDPDIPLRHESRDQVPDRRVIEIMHDSWPPSFEDWLRFRSEAAVVKSKHKLSPNGLVNDTSCEEHIPIRFSRDFDVPTTLPLALITLAGCPYTNERDEIRKDKAVYIRRLHAQIDLRSARWDMLDVRDYSALIMYREALAVKAVLCPTSLHRTIRDSSHFPPVYNTT
ncbi:hypothetical protein PHLGIDRAFT_428984 [Phlebiopsis gigantea 11061_1 CR5-6]|uniref:Uncharacterized protein n=1 Tax=Phlebiopsis gigantea (strain 11061_1 CR5-6) TaxID=745531 RepID=A0A0C3S861_PHLG1|nr:hypothetical protein PHLGIDRAFT_428984 [Phlebiopsis gigantea 11061_1 CR5-6]